MASSNGGASHVSVTKTLTRLLSVPSNRSCADCRAALVDSSQVHASFTPQHVTPRARKPDLEAFRRNHAALAPSSAPEQDLPVDPALAIPQLCAHGVFVCAMCAAAHKQLGNDVLMVKAVHATASWTSDEVVWFATIGGNAQANHLLEHFMPQQPRPITTACTVEDRVQFCRAKYQALGYCLPPANGPLAEHAWGRIIELHPEWEGLWDSDLSNGVSFMQGADAADLLPSLQQLRSSKLPNRLVDYFCVASPANHLEPRVKDLSTANSPEDIQLLPCITDCYPPPGSHGDDFPEHVSAFCFPDGCTASTMAQAPSFFTFVLTNSYGERLYGGVLRIYDDNREIVSTFREIMKKSKLPEDKFPPWLRERSPPEKQPLGEATSFGTEIMFMPKCLIVMSHYPFFDLWRKFLLQIYRIALTEAPLPIERFVANFVSEIPLPPLGRIQVEFGFTHKDTWVVQRPPENKLPLVNLSYKPLFTCLSVSNVLVVLGCLLQETKVALLSKNYSLLCPVSEAFISLMFPLHWQGMYVPILPYRMLDILDAPVPYLVGLHARYLKDIPSSRRPGDVVFVDLDRDTVHLGFEDISFTVPRQVPAMPSSKAAKLKSKLLDCAARVYVKPESGKVGTITTGVGREIFDDERDGYVEIHNHECRDSEHRRRDVLPDNDKAYRDNELLVPIAGFQVSSGKFHHASPTAASSPSRGKNRMNNMFKIKRKRVGSNSSFNGSDDSGPIYATEDNNVFDLKEPRGFSVTGIRTAFLQFFLSLLKNYRTFSEEDEFQAQEFVASLSLPDDEAQFVMNLISTQMFEGFLADRRECPDDSEILFFDESIDAKCNKSKKAMLTRAKVDTPFLNNTQYDLADTFVPPPPSNWGLPDDERTYHYGTFPGLNRSLFGKVREPKSLVDEKLNVTIRLDRRRMTAAARQNEQAIAKKAASSLTILGSTHGTLKHLSAPFSRWAGSDGKPEETSDKSSSEVSLPNSLQGSPDVRTQKEKLALSVRRRQAILISSVVKLQSCCRMYLVRRRRFGKLCSYGARSKFTLNDRAAMAIQSLGRSRRDSTAFFLVRSSVIRLQAAIRGFLVRCLMRKTISSRMQVYRNVIFRLWEIFYTPFCYRSTLWEHMKTLSVMRLAIAEEELHRLWARAGLNLTEDKVELESTLPIRIDTLSKSIQCQEILRGNDVRRLTPKASGGISVQEAKNRLQAERAQLYEKLSHDNATVDQYCSVFLVAPKEKKKKYAVTCALWSNRDVADASASLMIDQFPELLLYNNIHFVAPSSKSLRRFPVSVPIPAPLDKLARNRLDELIQDNIFLIAVTGIMLKATDEPDSMTQSPVQRRVQAVSEARGMESASSTRLILMRDMLYQSSTKSS